MATVTGSTFTSSEGNYYAKIVYTVTETSTTYRIKSDYYLHAVTALKESSVISWGMTYTLSGNTHSGSFETVTPTLSAGAEYHAYTRDVTITKTTSAKNFNVTFRCSNEIVGSSGGSAATVNLTIPALVSYNVSYAANGGQGAPSTQKKYYGKALTLSSTKPTRSGYAFNKWKATNGTLYNAGGSYTANAATTMTAQWTANTYTINYNANGGTGTIAKQTKTYGQSLVLSNGTGFSRANYILKGWATSANGTKVYNLGETLGANVIPSFSTLYAVWEIIYNYPTISNLRAERYTVDEEQLESADDIGQSLHVEFDWKGGSLDGGTTYRTPSMDISINNSSVYSAIQLSGEGSYSYTFSTAEGYSINDSHIITIILRDQESPYSSLITQASVTVPTAIFPIDILEDGSAMGLMMTAQNGKVLSVPNIFVDLSQYRTAGTDDQIIYDLLDQFGWLSVNT